jgi:hypothetical protein
MLRDLGYVFNDINIYGRVQFGSDPERRVTEENKTGVFFNNRTQVIKLIIYYYSLINIWPETRRCFIAMAFKFCFRICRQESPRKSSRFGTEWDTSAIGLC